MTVEEQVEAIDSTLYDVFSVEKLSSYHVDDLEKWSSMIKHHADIIDREITNRLYPWARKDPMGGRIREQDRKMVIE